MASGNSAALGQFMRRELSWATLVAIWDPTTTDYRSPSREENIAWANRALALLALWERQRPDLAGPLGDMRDAVVMWGMGVERAAS